MSENRPQLTLVVALSFIAGAAVGVAGTLPVRGSSTGARSAASTAPVSPAGLTTAATASPADSPKAERGGVYINEALVSQADLETLQRAYGAALPAAHYWYDPRSGLYGVWGFEAGGYIRPGHDFGPLPAEASNGTTGASSMAVSST
jgi:hypothetical protein